jgi:hypothetical protein
MRRLLPSFHIIARLLYGPRRVDVNETILEPNFMLRQSLLRRTVSRFAGHRVEASSVHWTLNVAAAGESRSHELKIGVGAGPVERVNAGAGASQNDRAAGYLETSHIPLTQFVEIDYIQKM